MEFLDLGQDIPNYSKPISKPGQSIFNPDLPPYDSPKEIVQIQPDDSLDQGSNRILETAFSSSRLELFSLNLIQPRMFEKRQASEKVLKSPALKAFQKNKIIDEEDSFLKFDADWENTHRVQQPIIGSKDFIDDSLFSLIAKDESLLKHENIYKDIVANDYTQHGKGSESKDKNKLGNEIISKEKNQISRESNWRNLQINETDGKNNRPRKSASEKKFMKIKDVKNLIPSRELDEKNSILMFLAQYKDEKEDFIKTNNLKDDTKFGKNEGINYARKGPKLVEKEEKYENIQSKFKIGANNILKGSTPLKSPTNNPVNFGSMNYKNLNPNF